MQSSCACARCGPAGYLHVVRALSGWFHLSCLQGHVLGPGKNLALLPAGSHSSSWSWCPGPSPPAGHLTADPLSQGQVRGGSAEPRGGPGSPGMQPRGKEQRSCQDREEGRGALLHVRVCVRSQENGRYRNEINVRERGEMAGEQPGMNVFTHNVSCTGRPPRRVPPGPPATEQRPGVAAGW